MAVNNTTKTYAKMEFPLAMQRQDAFALDPTCVWPSLDAAQEYAKSTPHRLHRAGAVRSDGR